jgi:hypothetical protein
MSVRFSFPESWSSTPLAKKRCQKHRQDTFVLATAFTLIEGHPQSWQRQHFKGWATSPPPRPPYG